MQDGTDSVNPHGTAPAFLAADADGEQRVVFGDLLVDRVELTGGAELEVIGSGSFLASTLSQFHLAQYTQGNTLLKSFSHNEVPESLDEVSPWLTISDSNSLRLNGLAPTAQGVIVEQVDATEYADNQDDYGYQGTAHLLFSIPSRVPLTTLKFRRFSLILDSSHLLIACLGEQLAPLNRRLHPWSTTSQPTRYSSSTVGWA